MPSIIKKLLRDRCWLILTVVLASSFHLAAQAPSPVSVSPSSGSGSQQLFTFTFTDPVSWTHIQSAQVIAGGVFGQASSCYFYLSGNLAYLADDSGTFHNPVTFGSAATIENSRCIIDAGSSSMTGSGTTWTVNLSILFKSAAAGSYSTMMEVYNGVDSGWAQRGS